MREILKTGTCSQPYNDCEECPYEDTNKCDFEEVTSDEDI